MTQKLLFNDAVGNFFTEVPSNKKSHVRGWAQHWAETLGGVGVLSKNDSLCGLDTLYFDHGVNAEVGTMNLFGGVTDQVVDRLEQVFDNPSLTIVSLDARMPVEAYVEGLRKRVGQASCSPRLRPALVDEFERRLVRDSGTWLSQEDFVTTTVCVGDSHATAYASRGQPVIRRNGLTLRGALKSGYFKEVLSKLPVSVERVTLVAGSIDMRHHVGLQPDPVEAAFQLACDLAEFALETDFDGEFELSVPVPVETETRRVPKTGWLNGRPFTGSQEDRSLWTQVFEETLRQEYYGPVVAPPAEWYRMDPSTYASEVMELSSSVHIAPTHYRRHGGWREC